MYSDVMKEVYYFVFGVEISKAYHLKGFEAALEFAKRGSFAVEKFEPYKEHPKLLLFESSQWGDFAEVKEDEYKQFLEINKK